MVRYMGLVRSKIGGQGGGEHRLTVQRAGMTYSASIMECAESINSVCVGEIGRTDRA